MGASFMEDVKLQFIPLINLRMEIANYAGLFNNEEFCKQFYLPHRKNHSINTMYESWYGRNELFLSRVIRSSILNVEAAICSCVYFEAGIRGIFSEDIKEATANPFSLGGKGTANVFYDKLPTLLNPDYSLLKSNNKLWLEVKHFYKNIRNPLFHGKELKENDPKIVKNCIDLILEVFKWIDSWFDINQLVQDGSSLANIPEFGNFIHQIVASEYVPNRVLSSREDLIETPGIKNILGFSISDYVHMTVETVDNKNMNLRLSPKAAMTMLAFLAVVHKHTGWPIPDRL
jgi:hypothetical protein